MSVMINTRLTGVRQIVFEFTVIRVSSKLLCSGGDETRMSNPDPTVTAASVPQQPAGPQGPAPHQQTGPPWPAPQQPPPAVGYDPARRPGTVTAAAVFAFIAAVLELLAALFMLGIAVFSKRTFGPPGTAWGYTIVNFALATLMIWGGIAALRGKSNKILVYTALVLAALQIVQTVLTIVKHFSTPVSTILGLILALLVVASLTTARSREFFIARGGTAAERRTVVVTGLVLAVVAGVAAVLVAVNSKPDQPTQHYPRHTRYAPPPTYRQPSFPTYRPPSFPTYHPPTFPGPR